MPVTARALPALVIASCSLASACADDRPAPTPDLGTDTDDARDASPDAANPDVGPSELTPFHLDRPLAIALTVDPSEWDALRFDAPELLFLESETCPPGPRPDAFDWHPAAMSVDGVALGAVEIRKKGFLGSLDPTKPSLKVKGADGQPLLGLGRLTLNNDHDDPTHLRQCLAYATFAAAGLAAPRCGLATVSVNGEPLGVFTQVESIDADFLTAHYGDAKADLYEGQLADFREPELVMFEPKTDDTDATLAPLRAVATALLAPGSVVDALEPVLDVDRFLTYWATEVLVTFWDGYSGNTNNYYAVVNPQTGKVEIVPWGTDEVMKHPADYADGWLGARGDMPWSVFAHGFIAHRLYADATGRERYEARLRERVATWDAAALTAWIEREAAVLEPVVLARERAGWSAEIAALKAFVAAQRPRLEAALDAGLPAWDRGTRLFECAREVRRAVGSFSAPWDSLADDPLTTGEGAVTETVGDSSNDALLVRALSGPIDDGRSVRLQVGYGPTDDGRFAFLQIDLPRELAQPGHIVLDGGQAYGQFALVAADLSAIEPAGFVLNGTLDLDQVSLTPGGVISGRFAAPVGAIVWDTSDPLAAR
ncbi:MAG: CotH kinase family protein [Myxococcota bacterium]